MPGYDEFIDPDSAIARILMQMQGAANRSRPGESDLAVRSVPQFGLPPGGAQPGPVGTGPGMDEVMGPEMDPQALIEQLLAGQVNR